MLLYPHPVYIDEALFGTFKQSTKALVFSERKWPINIYGSFWKSSESVVAVAAAITLDLGLVAYVIKEGYFDSNDFVKFIKILGGEIWERTTNPIDKRCFVLDNCSIHHSSITWEKYTDATHKLLFLPPYSPELNVIEYFWRFYKKRFESRIEKFGETDYDSETIIRTIDSILKEVTVDDVRGVHL